MKKVVIAALSALGLAGALVASQAEATCNVNTDCKRDFGCASCTVAHILGIQNTDFKSAQATDINGATTRYRVRRTTAGNGGGLFVEAQAVGSSFHTVTGSIACRSAAPAVARFTAVGSQTVFCPSGSTPVRADSSILFPDTLCPFDQICAFN